MEQKAFAFMLHPRLVVAEQRTVDGDDLAREKALIELVAVTVEAHDVVAAHPARLLDGHRLGELGGSRAIDLPALGKAVGRGAAEQAAMRSALVMQAQEAVEPLLKLRQPRQSAEMVGAA